MKRAFTLGKDQEFQENLLEKFGNPFWKSLINDPQRNSQESAKDTLQSL